MSDMKRYSFYKEIPEHDYFESETGEWVRFEDAEADKKAAVGAEREYIIENLLEEQLHWREGSAIHHDLFSVVIGKIRARGEEPEQ